MIQTEQNQDKKTILHNENCIFCKIIKGDLPCYKIYEDDDFLAFLDIFPLTEGHTLVIPKQHYETVIEHPKVGEYFEVASKVAKGIKKAFGLDYVDICVFGREVNHAHIRLHPYNGNWKDALDLIGTEYGPKVSKINDKEAIKIAVKIREYI